MMLTVIMGKIDLLSTLISISLYDRLMDIILKKFKRVETFFHHNNRIIDLLNLHKIKYRIDNKTIYIDNESFITNVFLNSNVEVFMILTNIVKTEINFLLWKFGDN
jgi:hypothetical protein